jgi:hypothetical protein
MKWGNIGSDTKIPCRGHCPARILKLLEKTARVFGCDTERFRQSERISSSDREDRDILVYFLWQTGRVTNERLGELFGVTYSAISHIVKGVKDQLIRDPRSREKIAKLHSQFKI